MKAGMLALLSMLLFVSGCAQQSRLGMIPDKETGILYGSAVERTFFLDPTFFDDPGVKVSVRNVSGDMNYDLNYLSRNLKDNLAEKGYQVAKGRDFSLKLDVSIVYSGLTQSDLARKYAFLGGAAGTIAGTRSDAKSSEAIGLLAGATLGAVMGSYARDNTYIMIGEVTLGVLDRQKRSERIVSFGDRVTTKVKKPSDNFYEKLYKTRIAVYAGGRNVSKNQVADEITRRFSTIVRDVF